MYENSKIYEVLCDDSCCLGEKWGYVIMLRTYLCNCLMKDVYYWWKRRHAMTENWRWWIYRSVGCFWLAFSSVLSCAEPGEPMKQYPSSTLLRQLWRAVLTPHAAIKARWRVCFSLLTQYTTYLHQILTHITIPNTYFIII